MLILEIHRKVCSPYIFLSSINVCCLNESLIIWFVPKERLIQEQSKLRDARAAVADVYDPFIGEIAQNRQDCVKNVS